MEALSRRKFVTTASLGAAAAGALGVVRPFSGSAAASTPDLPHIDSIAAPVVAHIEDLASGTVRLFTGEKSLVVTDHVLAQHLARAVS
jgi:hypothetical protein